MYARVVASLLFLISLSVLLSGVGGFLLLAEVLTVLSPIPGDAGSGDMFRLAYFALVFVGSLAILLRVGLLARDTLGGRVPLHLYMREALIYGTVMLIVLGTSCWLVSEWSRQLERGVI
ncbi:MAG TPA: hypothetical protein VND68_07295 [Chloroflexia bacterium]|nr:hypothetical protein [Chloroflexia bacterium]